MIWILVNENGGETKDELYMYETNGLLINNV